MFSDPSVVFWLSVALAVTLGGFLSCLELLTTKYSTTLTFLLRSRALYGYGFCYGALAGIAAVALDLGIFQGAIQLPGSGPALSSPETRAALSSPWMHALLAGVFTKPFMQLNLFTVALDSAHSMPIGLQTLTRLFDSGLLRALLIDEYGAVRAFVEPRVKGQSLDTVRTRIKNNTPASLPEPEKKAFAEGIDNATSPLEAMEKYLRFVGRNAFQRAFPP